METLQPKLRFPHYKGDWESKTLGEIFSIFNGYAFSSSDSIDDGVLWVKIADVGIQQMKKDNLSFLPFEYIKKHKKFILKKDDYVIALTRPILNGKLKIAKIDDFFDGSLLNQRVGKLISSNNSTFVFNLLQKDLLIKSIENNISGSDPPNLSPNEISFIESHIPSIEEQTLIANFLSAIDEKLNLLKEKKILLEEYKKGIMQKIFNQEIRFKDDNGNDFEDWEEKSLGECLDYEQPTNYIVDSTEYNDDYDTPVLTAGKTFILGYTNEHNGIYQKQNLPVIIFDDFTTATQFVDFQFKVKSSAMKILKAKANINIKYIYEVMQNLKFEVGGHGRHWISVYANLVIDFPSLKEQTKIANFLSAIDKKIALVSNQIKDTQEYKKGLLQQLFV